MGQEFIGAGWAFPLRMDRSGGVALVTAEREIEESIRLVLATSYGERPMRPEFGCGIHEFVFAPADSTTAGRVAFEVDASLRRWEPRIELVDVSCTIDPDQEATLLIDVKYRIRGTNDPRNLVFPFYVIPQEQE